MSGQSNSNQAFHIAKFIKSWVLPCVGAWIITVGYLHSCVNDRIVVQLSKADTIEAIVDRVFNDDKFKSKFSEIIDSQETIEIFQEKLHPMLIFDQNEHIQFNMGARKYVKNIEVGPQKDNFIHQIIIEMEKPGPAPLLTCIDETVDYAITTDGGSGTKWVYNLEPRMHSVPRADKSYFRLEILKGPANNIQYASHTKDSGHYFFGAIHAGPNSEDEDSFIQLAPTDVPKKKRWEFGVFYFDKRAKRMCAFVDGKWERIAFLSDMKDSKE